jgi:hypothetical protein
MDEAKTIDLCNNPLTKEHKLEFAKRAIPVCLLTLQNCAS